MTTPSEPTGMPHIERSCMVKNRFDTRQEAEYEAYLHSNRHKRLSTYFCRYCQGYHLTKQLGDTRL